jgi:hypothetical protein
VTEQEIADAVKLMERIGGSFASALAVAWQRADLNNQAKLKAAFPELLRDYHEMANIAKMR